MIMESALLFLGLAVLASSHTVSLKTILWSIIDNHSFDLCGIVFVQIPHSYEVHGT